MLTLTYTTVEKFRVSKILLNEINTFIQQGCFKLNKNDIKDMYNVTEDFK